jgi:glycerophosphoryl diester phosphodiesterase
MTSHRRPDATRPGDRGVRRRTLTKAVLTALSVGLVGKLQVEEAPPSLGPRPRGVVKRSPRGARQRLETTAHSISGGHITQQEEFAEAQDQGATIIDTDVHSANDRSLVVVHDRWAHRLPLPLAGPPEMFSARVLEHVFGAPTLEDAYASLKDGNKLALDVKKIEKFFGTTRHAMHAIVDMLHEHPERRAQTVVWLSDPEDVREFALLMEKDCQENPELVDVPVGLSYYTDSYASTLRLLQENRAVGGNAVSIHADGLRDRGEELVEFMHECGQFGWAWGIDRPDMTKQERYDAYAEIAATGIDSITVDDLRTGRQVAESFGGYGFGR